MTDETCKLCKGTGFLPSFGNSWTMDSCACGGTKREETKRTEEPREMVQYPSITYSVGILPFCDAQGMDSKCNENCSQYGSKKCTVFLEREQ